MRHDFSTLAYTAGIIDGEGCISITRNKKKSSRKGIEYRVWVTVSNTNEWLLNWLRFNYGGCVTKAKPRENCKQMYHWALSCRKAIAFLRIILPYIKIKRPEAELAIQFQGRRTYNRGEGGKSDEEWALDEADRILMKKYKGKPIDA